MAKIKIHELAKELEVSSKEVITFLNDKGMEVKSHMSSIEDEAIDLVKGRFGKKAEAPKAEAPKAEAPKPEAKAEPAKAESAKADAQKPAEAPKKKKNIIFVSNMQNSSMQRGNNNRSQNGGNRQNGGYNNGNNGRPGNGRPVIQQQQQHRPLPKPIIKPAALPSIEEEFGVPEKAAPASNRSENRNDNYNRGDNRHDNRNDNRGGNRNEGRNENRGDYRNNRNDDRKGNFQGNSRPGNGERRQGDYRDNRQDNRGGDGNRENNRDNRRPYGNNDRPNRGDGRPGNNNFRKPGASNKGFAVDAPIKDQEKHRDEEKRRQGQERDKRSKKDHLYEDDEMNAKSKMNKPGRFIKPEKKVEEKEEEQIKVIVIPENLTIKELADKMKIQPSAIVKKLFLQGQIVTVNQEIPYETAEEIAMDYEILCEKEEKVDIIEELLKEDEEDEATMQQRPPVICVMGHVDHGKTSLLDAIRKTNVTDREAGGITQHIGAYTVKTNDKMITFLDTPGHEAFTAMRLRGAKSTDIAILVVAADDGVMPQTVEAINHAKAAGIQIIVAVNKIDKPSANIDRVKQELTEHGLIAEDWGGDTIFCPVSAHTHEGLDNLLDMILLTSEMLELKANPNRKARGVVIEARLDKGRGPVATLLVQKGTLKVGDFIAIGEANGRVRAMNNDKGKAVKEATPSMPVEIIGLSSVPNSGDTFISTETEKEARQISEAFITRGKENLIAESRKQMSLDDIFNKMQEGTLKELNIIIKADVQGSVEALKQSLLKLSNEEVIIKCIHSGVGAINESDVVLASASSAIIIGFNIRPDAQAKALSDQEKVDIRLYNVIYNAIDDIESAMKGMLDPIYEEKVTGHAEVRSTFKASGVGTIAGCFILDGMVERNCSVRITRNDDLIFEGKLASLKRFKDDVKEVKNGYECGMVFENWSDLREGDRIEAYKMVEVERK